MNRMKKCLALILALTLLLTLAACGKDKGKDGKGGTTTTTGGSTTTTTTTPSTPDDELLPDDEADGSKELPFEIGGVLEFDAVVKAGGVTYYNVYRVGGTELCIESADAYVEYDGKTYEPVDGVVTFPVTSPDPLTPIQLAIGNRGGADATFKVIFTYPAGTKSNPIELEEGDLVTVLKEGDEDGMYYLFTATEEGTLTIVDKAVTKGESYDISLFNLTNSAIRTLEEDGVVKEGQKMVSIEVNKGDKVEVIVAVLPDDKNQYPAVTLKTQVAFVAGEVSDNDTPTDIAYTVTVKDKTGAVVSGVKLAFAVGGKTATATTNKDGVATATLPAGDGTVTVTIPEGYSGNFVHGISFSTPSITIQLTKVQPEEPEVPDVPDNPNLDYTVTVLDDKGAAAAGITVTVYDGETEVAKKTTDAKGAVAVNLKRGSYTVKLSGNTLGYDEKAATLTVSKPNLTLSLGRETVSSEKVWEPISDKRVEMYLLEEGATYVNLTVGARNYFLFKPTRAGTYRFASSNTSAVIGYYGESSWVQLNHPTNIPISGNAFNISVKEAMLDDGNYAMVIGLDANCAAAVVQITRVGDPEWDPTEMEAETYTGAAPKPITAPSGLTDVDIQSSTEHHLVYSAKDGYYHLDSQSGPVVYVRLDSPYASVVGMLNEFGSMIAYIYNADGTFNTKEQYAPLMQQYVDNMDKTQRVYPLTEDLKYMIENYGEGQNWWNAGEPGYLFEEVEGVNPANAWMFLFCYKK